MPQSFLETGQHIDVRTGLDKDCSPCRQTDLLEGRRKHILTGDDPEHLTARAGRNPCTELTSRRTVKGVVAPACHLMQCPQCQTATGQTGVYLAHTEGQHCAASVAMSFETADRGPQRLQTGFFMGFSSHVTARRSLRRQIS